MKITLINSTNTGGAGIACLRLAEALQEQGHTVNVLVQKEKNGGHRLTTPILKSKLSKIPYLLRQKKQEKILRNYPNRKPMLFSVPLGTSKIHEHPLVKDADIVHLHWTSDVFITTKDIEKMAEMKGKLYLTFHDMWYMTGGCHYAGDCTKYVLHCCSCPQLNTVDENDLSHRIFGEKQRAYKKLNLHAITPSKWMADLAKDSFMFSNQKVNHVFNAHNFNVFKPQDKQTAAKDLKVELTDDKKYILFGAMGALNDSRKGFKYLKEALTLIAEDSAIDNSTIELLVFGSTADDLKSKIPFKITMLGNITSEEKMASVYNLADVFVAPSLEDNLPNTLIEAMGCGTPCVGFNVGGIPEIIDHKVNGYVAQERNVQDLKQGIKFVLFTDNDAIREMAIKKVQKDCNYKTVAERHLELYNKG